MVIGDLGHDHVPFGIPGEGRPREGETGTQTGQESGYLHRRGKGAFEAANASATEYCLLVALTIRFAALRSSPGPGWRRCSLFGRGFRGSCAWQSGTEAVGQGGRRERKPGGNCRRRQGFVQVLVLTIDTTVRAPELAAGFLGAHSAS